ncbi:muscle-specific protein 300 kDa [Lepeophtheirus salmonis]|uniref:muscle-specific protein 300 kDa n=1 Tax=Lepeophtheirus salmonis TaxID=72036 RepID=UPI001AE693B5|nr:uncharacterized protein LOC121119118 [Lepeophtheirus salmonis]
MSFWQENYSFIKEVYDTRYAKMVEWMDNVEMAIQKVCASKVYTSSEFKREKDNFHSLCKNLERAETKRWLAETLDTLMKERVGEEKKEELRKLEVIMERHKMLIPRIQETLVKTECYWKCYSYGDDLIPIFEFIDDLRHRSIKEVFSANQEHTEEHIEKQDKVLNSVENKRRMVIDFISKGDRLMTDPNCPKFLYGHVQKLKEAWEDTVEKAQARKKALTDNFQSWETFEIQQGECHKQLDLADTEYNLIKKIFDLKQGPADYQNRLQTAAVYRQTIEEIFSNISTCNDIIQLLLPDDKKAEMNGKVQEIQTRMAVLQNTDKKLEYINDFNKRLAVLNTNATEIESWLQDGRKRIDDIIKPADSSTLSPEDKVTKTMEIMEDLQKKSEFTRKQEIEKEDIFPKGDERVPSDAKKFIARLDKIRKTIDNMEEESKTECAQFSQDIKYWAEFTTGIKEFEPWIKRAEIRKNEGLIKPSSLMEACQILGDSKNFQEECEQKIKTLDDAAASAQKMTTHIEADTKVNSLRELWLVIHEASKEWVSRMTTLVECWNKLDGNVGELSSWVSTSDSTAPEGESEISIEKLEGQLNQLKIMFAEKQKLVEDLEAYGPENVSNKESASSGIGNSDSNNPNDKEGEEAKMVEESSAPQE